MSPLDCMAFGYLLAIIVLSRRPMALQYWRPLIEYCAEAFWEVVLRRVTELNISDNKIGIIITTEGSLLQTTISIISNLIKYCLCSLFQWWLTRSDYTVVASWVIVWGLTSCRSSGLTSLKHIGHDTGSSPSSKLQRDRQTDRLMNGRHTNSK